MMDQLKFSSTPIFPFLWLENSDLWQCMPSGRCVCMLIMSECDSFYFSPFVS